jgi:hypothetical protein
MVDGNKYIIQQAGANDFGGKTSVSFGGTPSCVELRLIDLLKDQFGYEIDWFVFA